jgi:hypothetical protein
MKDRDELDAIVHGIVEKKALIEVALPLLNFDRIPVLLFIQECEEIEEFAAQTGLLISESWLPPTTVAGSRVANASEIWLYPDGSLQEYRKAATWETFESGCTQRHYVGPGSEEKISLEELREAIEFNLERDPDDA